MRAHMCFHCICCWKKADYYDCRDKGVLESCNIVYCDHSNEILRN